MTTKPVWVAFTAKSDKKEIWLDTARVLTVGKERAHTRLILTTEHPGNYYPVNVKEEPEEVIRRITNAVDALKEKIQCLIDVTAPIVKKDTQ